jgi:predicted ATPase/DNA-binding XRE family transcriptional regulator
MKLPAPGSFGAQLKALRLAAGFTQEELATIAGLSTHAVSALERGERRRPHFDTVRALSAALDLTGPTRDAFAASARPLTHALAFDELTGQSLPVPLTPLVGRDGEVQTLRRWLAETAARLITLMGPGGVGKTRLALELARLIANDGGTRVLFVALAAIRDVTFVAPAIAEALGLTDVGAMDLPKRARVACGDRATLLVLDNFEHVLEAGSLVGELLSAVPSLRALVTSRAPLHLRGERQFAVDPLALNIASDTTSPTDFARAPAVHLFVERLRDVQPDFRLTSANGPTVAAICRRLDALPLALELAAPWIKVLTLDDLLRGLECDRLPGALGTRDLPDRQRTVNATVAWSYDLLQPPEQRAFRRLGVLPGLFPVDAAGATLAGRDAALRLEDALWAVGTLIDKSLLLRFDAATPSRPLYQMLETVRAYAALELGAAGERDDALEGLARYCLSEASLAVVGLVGPAQIEWLDRVRADLDSYRVALKWLVDGRRSTEALQITRALYWFWVIRGHATEGLRWYEQILSQGPLASGLESTALTGAAGLRYVQGDIARARTDLSRALALAEESGTASAAVLASWVLGFVEYALGRLDAAHACFTRSANGFRAEGTRWGVGSSLTGLAWVALAIGDTAEAERLLDEAIVAFRGLGPWFLSLVEYLRALLAVRRGDADAAIALSRANLARIREVKDKFAFVYALVPLAGAAALKGHHAWVPRIIGAGDAVTDSTGAIVVDNSVRELREHVERDARNRLGPERWASAYAAGRRTSIDALIRDIDNPQPYDG